MIRRQPRRGAVTVWVVLCLFALVGVVAIGTDAGRLFLEEQRAQTAADGAALAAAGVLYQRYPTDNGLDPAGAAAAAAQQLAAANGFGGDATSTVTVNIPPVAGDFVGKRGYVEVIVQDQIPASFSGIFGSRTLTVTARAVARGIKKGVAGGGMYVLAPTGNNAFQAVGNNTLTIGTGSLYVNSPATSAVSIAGTATVTATSFQLVSTGKPGGTLNGPVYLGVPPVADPLANLPVPNPSSYPVQSATTVNVAGPVTLNPGVYQGGITVQTTGNLTLNPGVYLLGGVGLQVGGTVQGNGVMLYASAGGFSTATTATVNLSPPASGTYTGVSLYQDRGLGLGLNLYANHSHQITGAIYALSAPLTFNAGTGTGPVDVLGGMIVCSTARLQQGCTFNVSIGSGSANSAYGLVE